MIYPLKEKEGMLRLYHRKESIAEAAYCSYLGLRQKKRKQEFSLCRKTRRKQQVWFFTRIMRII